MEFTVSRYLLLRCTLLPRAACAFALELSSVDLASQSFANPRFDAGVPAKNVILAWLAFRILNFA